MKITRRGKVVALALSAVLAYGAGSAYAGALSSSTHYRRTDGPGPRHLVFRGMGTTEDSCARARLVVFDPDHQRSVYRCKVA